MVGRFQIDFHLGAALEPESERRQWGADSEVVVPDLQVGLLIFLPGSIRSGPEIG